jgi:hypothetical protein
MPKRTGNSSVNSSIRQGTKSAEEGFGGILAAQEASLGELVSIKNLLELSRSQEKNKAMVSGGADMADIQDKILSTLGDQLKSTKRREKTYDEWVREWRAESSNIAEMAKLMNTQGNVFEQMRDSFRGTVNSVKDKVGIKNGGLGRTVMGALNVGGIFNKSIEKSKFKEKQRLLGGDTSDANAEQAYQASKQIKAHDAKIEKFKAATGLSHEQMMNTEAGSKLLATRNELTDSYSATDKASHVFDSTIKGRSVDEGAAQEYQMEAAKDKERELKLLEDISSKLGNKATPEKVKTEGSSEGGGLMDMITGFLGEGFMTALKSMFSPMNILKSLGKVFAIGMIVGALFEGITDGFDEYMKTGSIGKALIAGLAGIVDFLTFGLFDKDAIKEVIGDFGAWIGEHVVDPFMNFFKTAKDGLMSALGSIGVPKMTLFKNPLTGNDVTVGPFYPFKSEGGSTSPEAPAPTSASTVDQKSADNAASAVPQSQAGGTTVVNAPTNNNTTQNQNIRAPIRNQDSSATRYVDSRQRYA